jgi:signal transduction histidine kinase
MTGAYAYTSDIWLPLATVILMAALGLYCWRRGSTPGALPLLALTLFTIPFAGASAFEAAAVDPATQIAWFKIHSICMLPALTCGTCFVLEYSRPRRWLTPRNLALFALPPLLALLLIIANGSRLMWQSLEVTAGGLVVPQRAPAGQLAWVYGLGLVLVNAAALLWLYIRSPQHRWPAAIMLFGQIAARGLFLIDSLHLSSLLPSFDWTITGVLIASATYVIALFGFRIFDPVVLARQTAIEQIESGMLVLDVQERVASMNPAAERILGLPTARARGQPVRQLLPAYVAGPGGRETELSLGTGDALRQYTLATSPLKDGRGLEAGYLLLLHDVTAQRRAQAQILEQQRALATLQERERLARELHDGLGQALAAAHLQASAAKRLLARGDTALVDECLDNLAETTLHAEADVREYLLAVKTGFAPDRPFFATLREYITRFTRQYGLPVELTVPAEVEERPPAQAVSVQLFRIIQEALSNVRKHARAHCVQVSFALSGTLLRVVVADDGRGFDAAAVAAEEAGFGLRSMRERVQALGGTLEVGSRPGQGTQVVVLLPISG